MRGLHLDSYNFYKVYWLRHFITSCPGAWNCFASQNFISLNSSRPLLCSPSCHINLLQWKHKHIVVVSTVTRCSSNNWTVIILEATSNINHITGMFVQNSAREHDITHLKLRFPHVNLPPVRPFTPHSHRGTILKWGFLLIFTLGTWKVLESLRIL
jgi:hypothetical protein